MKAFIQSSHSKEFQQLRGEVAHRLIFAGRDEQDRSRVELLTYPARWENDNVTQQLRRAAKNKKRIHLLMRFYPEKAATIRVETSGTVKSVRQARKKVYVYLDTNRDKMNVWIQRR